MLTVVYLSGKSAMAFAQQNDSVPLQYPKPKIQYGVASYYAGKFVGQKTASGEIYTHTKMTAAHNTLPLGTYIKVTNLRNKRAVVVKVNDRLHHKNPRLVDLSKAAAEALGFVKTGTTRVKVEVLGKTPPKLAP